MCATDVEFAYFLSIIEAPFKAISDTVVVVMAQTSDVWWMHNGTTWCVVEQVLL